MVQELAQEWESVLGTEWESEMALDRIYQAEV
jgi:hypothetical protein